MGESRKRKWLSAAVLLIALALIAAGLLKKHLAYPFVSVGEDSAEPRPLKISDAEFIRNTTFTGFEKIGGDFYYTYNQKDKGKQTCPT